MRDRWIDRHRYTEIKRGYEQTDRSIDKQAHGQIQGVINRQTDNTDELTEKRMNRYRNG